MQRPSGTQIRLFAALAVAVLILVYSATNTGRPPQPPPEKATHKAKPARAEKPFVLPPCAPADADFARYEMVVSRNLFPAPKPPEPKQSAGSGNLPPLRPAKQTTPRPASRPAPAAKPAAPAPLAGWSYVGYVVFGGKKLGIMQSDSANTTQDVEVGAQFQGYKVESITGEEIVLAAGGSKQVLKRPADFQTVPLGGTVPEVRQRRRP